MTEDDFRQLALSQPEAEEKAHMDHPDFRVANKIFASLTSAEVPQGVLKLSASYQHQLLSEYPDAFEPAPGAWGQRGWTRIHLARADQQILADAMRLAWREVAPKKLLKQFPLDG
jgi:hypothetical protein